MTKARKSLKERMLDAEVRGSRWLADANEFAERGEKEKADRAYERSQYWLDRFNKLAGNA